jgi:RES domain-containing protein
VTRAFSGEGARIYGGRWNSKGVPVVYTAATRSLAMLEILVHLKNAGQINESAPYLLYPATFDEALVDELADARLPLDWDMEPPISGSRAIGDAFVAAAEQPILAVPSVVVPAERNYLLNPAHRLFGRITLGKPIPCRFDPRLL